MITPTQADVGRRVVYRPYPGAEPEAGVIQLLSGEGDPFVLYDGDGHTMLTRAADLEWAEIEAATASLAEFHAKGGKTLAQIKAERGINPAPERINVCLGGRYRRRDGQIQRIVVRKEWMGDEPEFGDGDRFWWRADGWCLLAGRTRQDSASPFDLLEVVEEPRGPPPEIAAAGAEGWQDGWQTAAEAAYGYAWEAMERAEERLKAAAPELTSYHSGQRDMARSFVDTLGLLKPPTTPEAA